MELMKECFLINIWACNRKHAKHQYYRISDFVMQKPMRTRSISSVSFTAPIHDIFRDYKRFLCKRAREASPVYHLQHRYMIFLEITRDSYASAKVSLSLSLSLTLSLSLSSLSLSLSLLNIL